MQDTFWSHLSWLLAFRFWLFHVFPRRLWEHLRSHPNAAVGVRHTSVLFYHPQCVGIKAQQISKTSVVRPYWYDHVMRLDTSLMLPTLAWAPQGLQRKNTLTKIKNVSQQLIDMRQHDSTCMDIGCNIEDVTNCNNINIRKPLGNHRYP